MTAAAKASPLKTGVPQSQIQDLSASLCPFRMIRQIFVLYGKDPSFDLILHVSVPLVFPSLLSAMVIVEKRT